MIPLIALMIGAYICTRMLELIIVKQEFEGASWLKVIVIFAAIATIVITIFCVILIFTSSLDIPEI